MNDPRGAVFQPELIELMKVVLDDVEFDFERFVEISRVRSFDISDFTFNTNTDAEIETKILPIALRCAAKRKPHIHLCIASQKHASVCGQLTEIVNRAFY